MDSSSGANEGFDRLQELLLSLHVGDELAPGDAADITGLSPEICRTVFLGLERAGLMSQKANDRFVRRSLNVTG